jgi:uncharacterized protein YoxC
MSKPAAKTSQRFSRAARAERDRLARKRSQLYQRREQLQGKVDSLDEELEAVDKQLQMLEDFAASSASTIQIREVEQPGEDIFELLSGSMIRMIAVPLLLREHGQGPIHYRDWYALLNRKGFAVAGKRPDAVFLNQVNRSPLVRPSTKSGYYALDLDAAEQLKEQLRAQQAELGELMRSVPDNSDALEAHRLQQRELTTAISRTERDLREAIHAVEAAQGRSGADVADIRRDASPAETKAA